MAQAVAYGDARTYAQLWLMVQSSVEICFRPFFFIYIKIDNYGSNLNIGSYINLSINNLNH